MVDAVNVRGDDLPVDALLDSGLQLRIAVGHHDDSLVRLLHVFQTRNRGDDVSQSVSNVVSRFTVFPRPEPLREVFQLKVAINEVDGNILKAVIRPGFPEVSGKANDVNVGQIVLELCVNQPLDVFVDLGNFGLCEGPRTLDVGLALNFLHETFEAGMVCMFKRQAALHQVERDPKIHPLLAS